MLALHRCAAYGDPRRLPETLAEGANRAARFPVRKVRSQPVRGRPRGPSPGGARHMPVNPRHEAIRALPPDERKARARVLALTRWAATFAARAEAAQARLEEARAELDR